MAAFLRHAGRDVGRPRSRVAARLRRRDRSRANPGWGQAATVHTDTYPDKAYPGQISFIASEAEFTPKQRPETHKERVTPGWSIESRSTLKIPEHELKPGMPADATIHLGAPVQSGNIRG